MISKLMNNKWYFWLGGLLPVIALGLLQIPFVKFFTVKWRTRPATIYTVVIALVLILYVAWVVVYSLPKETAAKRLLLVWGAASLVVLAMYLLPLFLVAHYRAYKIGYYLSVAIVGSLVLITLPLTLVGGNNVALRRFAAGAFALLYLAAYVVSVYYAATLPLDKTVVVKSFVMQDTLPMGEGQEIKVILLNGQSNASGTSRMEYLEKTASAADYERYLRGYDNVMINYFDDNGSATSGGGFVYVSSRLSVASGGFFGPEIGMADMLSAEFPGETIYVIKYAWGGSNLHDQWLSPSSEGETGELYTAFVNFTSSCLNYLESKNYKPKIYAMCWMQGESDSREDTSAAYGVRSANLIKDVREEFAEYASDEGIYFLEAGISDSELWEYYEVVNAAKKANADKDPKHIYIDTIAEGLTYDKEPTEKPDLAHYDALSMIRLGNLFAEELIPILK